LKAHHCLADGLGFASMFMALSGEYDASSLPGLKPLPWYKSLAIFLTLPFLVLKSSLQIIFTCRNSNAIKKLDIPMSGKRNGFFIFDIEQKRMKAFCKSVGCTINDYTTAVISNTLYEYFQNHKNEQFNGSTYDIPQSIDIGMPYSLR
jgi:NRPS condensation-like uncharacterized protein